jgi:folate-binding protein YgfZ
MADLAGTTWIDVEPGTGAALHDFLQKMRFMLRVEPADVTADWAVLSVVGPKGAEVLVAAGLPAPVAPYEVGSTEAGFVRAMPPIGDGAPVVDLVVPRSELAPCAERLLGAGATPAGSQAFEALRVEARRPRLGVDTDHRTIPNELSWLRTAVHLDKGCYRGQETVARVHNLGRPPRRLVLLHLDGVSEVLPEPGTPVLAGAREVGRVGTVVRHHELGVIALALVKRSVAADAALTVGGAVAAVDPDDLAEEAVDTAARERVRAIRSATIGR